MTSKTLYPHTVSQSSETNTNFREFNNLGNIKNSKNTYAKTGQIASKSGTHKRPSSVTAKNFKANIPIGSKINKITVEYAADYEGNISIGKPTLNILKANGKNKKGKALTKTMTKSTISWSGKQSIANINSNNFGVSISFPSNTKSDTGYVKIKYLRIIIDYTIPNYRVTASKVKGNYTNDEFKVKINASNVNKTKGDSTISIQLPAGVNYSGKDSGTGNITNNGSNLVWKPGLNDKILSQSIVIKLKITTDGNHKVVIHESASSHSITYDIVTTQKPDYIEDPITEPEEEQQQIVDDIQSQPGNSPSEDTVLQVKVNEKFRVELYKGFSQVYLNTYYANWVWEGDWGLYDPRNQVKTNTVLMHGISYGQPIYWNVRNDLVVHPTASFVQDWEFEIKEPGYYVLLVTTEPALDGFNGEVVLNRIYISVKPSVLLTPFLSVFKLSSEELARLGDGIVYTIQSYLKLKTSEKFVRDWDKNFRIGIMNNINPNIDTSTVITDTELDGETGDEISVIPSETEIVDETDYENLTMPQIFEYAEYWSKTVSKINQFEDIHVEFPYNEKYPVYIIITGDYAESYASLNNIAFTEPCIVESDEYNGREPNGKFPIPINNILLSASEPSEVSIDNFGESSRIIVYDPPVDEDYGTTEKLAIRGIKLTADIDYTDSAIIFAKLKIPTTGGYSIGNRSIVLTGNEDTINIGDMYDTWGLDISELINLKYLELELGFENGLEDTNDSTIIKLSNIQLIFYSNEVPDTPITVRVNGENVSWYGMYVKDVTIPAGINTETKYLAIEGTDTNNAYRQNIKEKRVKIDFEVDGCDLIETTNQLQKLARLFTNERDNLNMPIPNIIEFSIFPEKLFEYILEDTFDNEIRVSDYKGSVELIIPDGTAFEKEDTVTNVTGCVDSIAAVNPLINITNISNANIVVSEIVSVPNQVFKLNYENFETSDVITIDCINRKVHVTKKDSIESVDITETADFNVDWFKLQGEFNFNSENCSIQTVTYNQRS